MMEGMNQGNGEEYILAMRSAAYTKDDSELWKQRRSQPLKSGVQSLAARRKTKVKTLLPMSDDHQNKVLASLVPDEIIYNVNDYSYRNYQACLLFGDISGNEGFTDLCEMYNKSGKGGPSRLTVVLNGYIGSMVQEVISHNGDVLKFSGDAFLAMYKCRSHDSLQDVVHEALDAAVMIQKSFGTYETDVGVFLRVKLAISAGKVIFSLLGDAKNSYYVCVGQPILDVKAAEKKANAGEIILSSSAWRNVNLHEYQYEHMGDGIHTKVKGVGLNWRPTQRNMESKNQNQEPEADTLSRASSITTMNYDSTVDFTKKKEKEHSMEDISLRPSVDYAAKKYMKEDLRRFIIPSIMRGIDLDEPIEYLTEMRQIVIVFINVTTSKVDWRDFVKLIDTIFKIICGVVNEMQGCVNKMSTFDKDLMYVLLFGLRGYKNEYESQIGLRCASECYHAISKLPTVTSTSVGVTTGMTYCGVVGHTLRREYTVISLTVNKAARLMCAYPNKVTCDRETFLHSKLEARNFILQEYKPLKGIANVGPVYEFKEQTDIQKQPTINPFPILGRNEQIRLYTRTTQQCLEFQMDRGKSRPDVMLDHQNMLVICGEARIGKTRLLDECVFITPPQVPVNRFTLMKRDGRIPYQTVEYIFSVPLGFEDLTTAVEREAKLKELLQKLNIPEFLCALNKVFNINFEKTPAYLALDIEEKLLVLRKILKQLCYLCFTTFWLIAIDDADYMDIESWKFLNTMLDTDLVFIIMTLSIHKDLCHEAQEILDRECVKTINISSIDKWFHAGLACQVLDVYAISPELEKMVQTRSEGNPGWIESFLVSLIQAGGLVIRNMPKKEINDMGLVSPPIDMLFRAPGEIEEQINVFETENYKRDPWKLYQHSYRDSVIKEMKVSIREKKKKIAKTVPVCMVSSNFKLEDIGPELSMNVMIIKMFDSLTSYEQHLLKCSSVLGDYFPRDMLIYVMASTIPRDTALAVQKLFELRVLGCAQGDFSEGDVCMFTQKISNPNQDNAVKCTCKALKVNDTCYDLPKYASCGYMRFKNAMFRETTYNLLTDNQRKEFHIKAIRYLEKETRRCRSCGNGIFVKILGNRYDDSFVRKTKKIHQKRSSDKPLSTRISATSSQRDNSDVLSQDPPYAYHGSDVGAFNVKGMPGGSGSRKETMHSSVGTIDSNVSALKNQNKDGDFELQFCLPCRTIHRLKRSFSLTRTFSYADFSSCQCSLILNTMYNQILEHCKGAGHTEKMLDALLEYSYICIISYNIPHALKILNEAQNAIEQQSTMTKNEDDLDTDWKYTMLHGRIQTLIGHARLELGQLEEAYICFQKSLKYYGYKFPTKKPTIKLRTFTIELKHRLGMNFFPSLLQPRGDEYDAQFCDNVSDCLSLLFRLFKDVKMWDQAELAAAWSLNKSLQSDLDFYSLCTSYANMLEVAGRFKKTSLSQALEVNALKVCHRKKSSVEIQELKAVAYLYGAVFINRIMRAEIDYAVHIGFIVQKICSNIHAISTIIEMSPMISHALIISDKIMDAVTVVIELSYYASEDSDNSGRTWFHALCVGFQLETGYCIAPFSTCDNYYQIERDTLLNMRDVDAERRFYTVMWLWCIRSENWEAATVWYNRTCDFPPTYNQDSVNNMFTSLYLLEGLLLFLVGKMDKRNVEAIARAYEQIDAQIKVIESAGNVANIILPRFYHLMAYYKYIKSDEEAGAKYLEKAKKLADKHGNLLERGWLDHSEKAWNNNLPSISIDFWKEHVEPDNLLDYHEVELNDGQLGYFTLPLPIYY